MKAPRKPKMSASISTWKNYDEKKKQFDSDKKAKEAIVKKYKK